LRSGAIHAISLSGAGADTRTFMVRAATEKKAARMS